jgi:outer membrane lipoprotein-sorting protein
MAWAAAFLAGCASEKRQEAALAHMGDESPPDFFLGPASAALTNFDGFSASVVSTSSAGSATRTVSGQVIERRGQIIYQPLATAKVKGGKIVRGGMYFIWDSAAQRGYVVSEALQGFAPISAPARITSVTPETKEPVAEPANGHACHRIERTAALSDDSTAKLTEWRADDLNRFPVRVRTESQGRQITVDFSDIRLDIPPPELFVPHDGFTQYASATALINELMIRESSLKKGASGESPPPGRPAGGYQSGLNRPQ